jgi:arylsulfatase A-like enzyme
MIRPPVPVPFRFLRALFLFALCLPAAPLSARQPNIVFVMADDLGYGDLGCYGQTRFTTPNIDRLAAEGTRFTQVYAGSTVCAPSRCTLMTGLHTGHCSVRRNMESGSADLPLPPGDVTVAEVLRGAGYATGGFGKWGLGGPGSSGHPNAQGFDEWFGYLDQRHAHSHYPDHLYRNGARFELDGKRYSHDLVMDETAAFVRRHAERPFFVYLSLTIPHASLEVPDDSLRGYLGKFQETPFTGKHYAHQAAPRAAFAAMIDRFDRSMGRLVALLAELGIERDTVVFLTSDNGPHAAGGGDPQFFRSSGPLRGIKRDLYEGGIRVPMIVRWPGTIPAGRVSDKVWAPGLDGLSMAPTLLGEPQQDHEYLYWEASERGFQQALRVGRWKAVRLSERKGWQLYDLTADLGERRDVAAEHPEVIARVEKLARSARTRPPR